VSLQQSETEPERAEDGLHAAFAAAGPDAPWKEGTADADSVHPMSYGHVAFLAETSRCLAQSLDYESTLRTVAGLALPALGSWCIVDIVEPDGSMRRIAIVHPDPRKQALATGLMKSWPPSRDDPLGAPCAVRTRQVEVIPHVDDEMLVAVARDEDNLRTLRALGIGSVAVVPLMARGAVLGALTLVSADGGRPYVQADMDVAEDLGARCAMAIDNARLHREARDAGRNVAQVNERLVIATVREQELAEQAREANLAKSHFLSSMSHELRTPINSIVGYADLLDLEIAGPLTAAQRAYLARVQASSAHLIKLVDDVLDLARVEAGRMHVKQETAQAERAISDAIGVITPLAEAGGITVEYEGGGVNPYLGDEYRVRQILLNLLANAVKFTDRGGRITVRCGTTGAPDVELQSTAGGPWVFIEVADTGIGIAADMAESVFEPFVQADEGHTRRRDGTGLGLTISRELARHMAGDLTLRSEIGAGSRFTLWLPSAL
jgi:signal transduction histidine kinase